MNLHVKPILKGEWESFHFSILDTKDEFLINISEKLGEVFWPTVIFVDGNVIKEVPNDNAHVNGIFIGTILVGLIDINDRKIKSGEMATWIDYILIHPFFQKMGIGEYLFKKIIEITNNKYIVMNPCSEGSKRIGKKLGFVYDPTVCNKNEYVVLKKGRKKIQ